MCIFLFFLPLSLFITYVCTLVSQFSFNTHFPADFGAFPLRCLLKFLLPQFTVCVENICLSSFLSAFLSVCVFLCMSVCMYIHIYILTRISIYIHTYVSYSISIWIWIWIYIFRSVTLAPLIGQRP